MAFDLRACLLRDLEPVGRELVPNSGEVPAAVLVPILGGAPPERLVFTRRTTTLSRHAGEVSFPGGLMDAGETPVRTALREAEEEIGLPSAAVEVLGILPVVRTRVSGVLIQPVVGWLEAEPSFVPCAAEIAEVLVFPFAELAMRGGESDHEWRGERFPTFVYAMDGATIWGATARILRSLLELVARADSG